MNVEGLVGLTVLALPRRRLRTFQGEADFPASADRAISQTGPVR